MVTLDDGVKCENSDTDPVNMMHLGHLSFSILSLAKTEMKRPGVPQHIRLTPLLSHI